MASHKRFVKNTFYQYAMQIAKYFFQFITLPYLTRVLGPDAFAVRVYVLSVMNFLQAFLDFGFNSYGIRAIAEARGNKEAEEQEMSAIELLRVVFCLIGAVALVLLIQIIPMLKANQLYCWLAYLTICAKATIPDFIFQGKEEMEVMTKRFVISESVATGLILLVVHSAADLVLVPSFELAGSVVALVWSWHYVFKHYGLSFKRVSREKINAVVQSSFIFFIATAATTVFSSLTTVFLGLSMSHATPAEISYWSIAVTASGAIQALYAPIANSLYPHMVKNHDFGLLKTLLLIGMPVDIIGTVAFAMLSNLEMSILGGPEYLPGAYVMTLIAPLFLFSFPATLIGYPVLAAFGEDRKLTTSSVSAAIFNMVAITILLFTGNLTLRSACILRCCTEAVLLLVRVYYVVGLWREHRGDASAARA